VITGALGIILWDAAWPREITNPDLGFLPVIEDMVIGTAIVGMIWWFASLRNKRDPEGAARIDQMVGD
jgi:hypothetical protein